MLQFTEQLEELLISGIPLKKALILLKENDHDNLLLQKILLHLNNGLPFSKVIEKEKLHFDPLLPFFISSGEAQGDLCKALQDFNKYQQEKSSFTAKIKKQLFYPSLVLIVAFGALFLMSKFMLPTMLSFFQESQIDIPQFMISLVGLNNFLQNNILWLFLFILAFALLIYQKKDSLLPALVDKLPLIRTYRKQFNIWQLFQNLAVLTRVGLPLMQSLSLQESSFAQLDLKEQIRKIKFHLQNGLNFSRSLSKENWLDKIYIEIIATAEHSGQIANAFQRVAEFQKKEIDRKLETFIKWLEPAVTLILGGLVAIFLLLTFYPLTKILNSLG